MEKKYPVLKCNEELWNEIKPVLESFDIIDFSNFGDGSDKNDFQFELYPYLVTNYGNYYIDKFLIGNIDNPHIDEFNTLRYIVNTKEEFLFAVAKLLGKEYPIKKENKKCASIKYPSIKFNYEIYIKIKDIINNIGYSTEGVDKFGEYNGYLCANKKDVFGNVLHPNRTPNTYLCSSVKKFLIAICELKGFKVSYINNTEDNDSKNHYFGYCVNKETKTIDIYENEEESGLQAIVVEKSAVPKKKFKKKKERHVVSYDPAVGESSIVVATIPAKDNNFDKDKGSDLDIDKPMENINIANKLKHCKKGTKLYHLMFGEVEFDGIDNDDIFVITTNKDNEKGRYYVNSFGLYDINYPNGECLLFPSKDNRDWNNFQVLEEGHRVMASDDGYLWIFRNYCYNDICSASNLETVISYKYIVPIEDFDFTAEDITINKEKSII